MRTGVRLIAALILTVPAYLGLANSPLNDWFLRGNGWRAFEPWFHFLQSVGFRGEGNMLIGTMLAVSFVLACVVVWLVARLVHQPKPRARR